MIPIIHGNTRKYEPFNHNRTINRFYRNEYLFSETYLQELMQLEEDAAVKACLNTLAEYREYADTSSLTAWNQSFVHEMLQALEFGVRREDKYVALLYQLGSPDRMVSLCYSLLPTDDLDNTRIGQNWAERIIRQLRTKRLHWGILTNGEQWWIYHTEEPTPYENYLEINLAEILQAKDVRQFQIFDQFMKAENFIPLSSGANDSRCQFDVFKQVSQNKIAYIEQELKKALKQQEEGGKGILSNLCMGYVDDLRTAGTTDFSDDMLRDTIYGSAMLYMFRLLFLFYADARNLLADADHDLFCSIYDTAKQHFTRSLGDRDRYGLWEQLREVFSNIEVIYNGGLFNPEESPLAEFIEERQISDGYLSPILFYMSYYEDNAGNVLPISYRETLPWIGREICRGDHLLFVFEVFLVYMTEKCLTI